MKLTWFGTAGFQIETDQHTILIDPYFTRNPQAIPKQPLQASDINQADMIFISHGHFGSAGSSYEELQQLGRNPSDILLVPMQGHTLITRIAHQYVNFLQPKMVIPHHQDNFFPPISMQVSTDQLVKRIHQTHPQTIVHILEMNQVIEL